MREGLFDLSEFEGLPVSLDAMVATGLRIDGGKVTCPVTDLMVSIDHLTQTGDCIFQIRPTKGRNRPVPPYRLKLSAISRKRWRMGNYTIPARKCRLGEASSLFDARLCLAEARDAETSASGLYFAGVSGRTHLSIVRPVQRGIGFA